ncbi:MAG: NAD(P)-dependent oxidoreductase [Saprospiraceae bacterium]
MPNKKILITGANGFIGTYLIEKSISLGMDVYCAVRANSNITSIKDTAASIITVDYHDIPEMTKMMAEYQFDYIIHNVGLTKSPDPDAYMRVNKDLLVNLVEAIKKSNLKISKLLFVSSLASYGPADFQTGSIVRDDSKPHPVTHYGRSKLAAENYLRSQSDIPYIILRPTAVYGPGEKDLLNVFQLVNKRIDIHPGLMPGKFTFIYIKDLTELIMAALMSDQKNKGYFATDGNIYLSNALSGFIAEALQKRTLKIKIPIFLLKGIAYASEKVAGYWDSYPPLNVDKMNEIKAKNWNCDVSNLQKDLGWEAQYDLQKGVVETVAWYKKHKWL